MEHCWGILVGIQGERLWGALRGHEDLGAEGRRGRAQGMMTWSWRDVNAWPLCAYAHGWGHHGPLWTGSQIHPIALKISAQLVKGWGCGKVLKVKKGHQNKVMWGCGWPQNKRGLLAAGTEWHRCPSILEVVEKFRKTSKLDMCLILTQYKRQAVWET